MLSLCMIVKDEADNLKKFLPLISIYVEEIIIVDTGSLDNSKEVALEFTDKIYEFTWCNDFSAARNFSISKATNDWILILDADEYITTFSVSCISQFILEKANEAKVGRIQRVNITEENLLIKKSTERINRLFNRNNFYYEGIIHEQLNSKGKVAFDSIDVDIKINHLGYTKESLDKTKKLQRNISLLNIAISENNQDPYLYYQLGKAFYLQKDYNSASINFQNALAFKLNYNLEYVTDLVETYGYSLINQQRYEEAISFESYLRYYNNADFYFLLGLIYMNNARFNIAVESFLKCTEFSNGKVDGITTFLPYYNIGVIFDVLGHKREAAEFYGKCGSYEPALKRLKAQLN